MRSVADYSFLGVCKVKQIHKETGQMSPQPNFFWKPITDMGKHSNHNDYQLLIT